MNRNDREFIVSKIRSQYTEKTATELDALCKLDSKVKRPANIAAYAIGTLGAIVMGCGMSLVMTDIGETLSVANPMAIGTAIGLIGMAIAIVNYPIYKGILASRKKKYAADIIALSDRLARE